MAELKDPTPPPVNFVDMPGFKEAVAAGVMSVLAESGTLKPGGGAAGFDQNFFDRMAMSFATLAQQGSGKVYVAPAVLQQRQEARDLMNELIETAMRDREPATYMLTARIQLMGENGPEVIEPLWQDKQRVTQPTIIDWEGVPNEAMKPQNATAEAIFAAYKASIGNVEIFEPKKRIALTAKGRVVSGNAVKAHMVKDDPHARGEEPKVGFKLHHADQPGRTVQKHILGTIAPPATIQI